MIFQQRFQTWSAWWLLTASSTTVPRIFSTWPRSSHTCETLFNYAKFLKLQGKTTEAREWTQKLMAKKRTLPGYMQRIERPWFRKGKALHRALRDSTP